MSEALPPPSPAGGASGRGLTFAAACYAAASVSFAPAVHANFLTALAREFHLGVAGSSLYLSLNFWGAIISLVAAGPLAGRLGARRVLGSAWLLQMASVATIGLAPVALVAYGGVLLSSVSTGCVSVLAPYLVSGLYVEGRNRRMSFLMASFTLGAIVGNLLVLFLFAIGATWRVGYLTSAALSIPWGFLLFASRHAPRVSAPRVPEPAGAGRGMGSAARAALLVFLVLCVAQFGANCAEVSTSMWIPTFLTRELNAAVGWGPLALLLYCVLSVVGKLGNASLIGRIDDRILLAAGLALFAGGIMVAFLSTGPAMAVAGFCLVGMGTGAFSPTATVWLAERYPHARPSRYSVFYTIANTGPIIGPLVLGMSAAGNLRIGMLTMLPFAVLATVLLLVARPPRRAVRAA
jgi:MFS family permease